MDPEAGWLLVPLVLSAQPTGAQGPKGLKGPRGGHLLGQPLALHGAGLEFSRWLWLSVGQVNYPKVADSSSFDEDSSDALSPEQPASHESQGSVPSPLEARVSEPLPSATSVSPTQVSWPPHMLPLCPGAPDLLELRIVRSLLRPGGTGTWTAAALVAWELAA